MRVDGERRLVDPCRGDLRRHSDCDGYDVGIAMVEAIELRTRAATLNRLVEARLSVTQGECRESCRIYFKLA
jgi:hypothetical protein